METLVELELRAVLAVILVVVELVVAVAQVATEALLQELQMLQMAALASIQIFQGALLDMVAVAQAEMAHQETHHMEVLLVITHLLHLVQQEMVPRIPVAVDLEQQMVTAVLAEVVLSSFAIFLKVLQCFHLILTEDLEQSQL
jgi:hypothetical protein